MISEIVITPDCFAPSDNNDLLYILKDILLNGIVIVDFSTGNWYKYILKNYVNTMEQSMRSEIVVLLKRIKNYNRIVKMTNFNHNIDSNTDWLYVSKLHYNENSIDIFIVDDTVVERCHCDIPEKCYGLNEVLSDDMWDELKTRNIIVLKTPSSFKIQLESILPHTKKLSIIDPYLEPDNKNKLALEVFANYYGNRKFLPQIRGTIVIHTKIISSLGEDTTKIRWKTLLKNINNHAKHTFKVYFWGDNSPEDKFHDRFLLTDAFAISSLHSFSIKEGSQQETTWGLLDRKLFEKYTLDYTEETSKFQQKCDPLIVVSV